MARAKTGLSSSPMPLSSRKLRPLDVQALVIHPRFRKALQELLGGTRKAEEGLAGLAMSNDSTRLAALLREKTKPIYSAGWQALDGSASVLVHLHRVGGMFLWDASQAGYEGLLGPYRTVAAAAQGCRGVVALDFGDNAGQPIRLVSQVGLPGRSVVSDASADRLFESLFGLRRLIHHAHGTLPEFIWGDVPAMTPFRDPFHDPIGELAGRYHAVHGKKGQRKLDLQLRDELLKAVQKAGYQRMMFRHGQFGFSGLGESCVMRVGLRTKGNLIEHRGRWVRMCYESKYGFNIFLWVGEIEMPPAMLAEIAASYSKS